MYSAWRCLIYFSQIWRGGILELFSTINPCLSGLKLYSIHTMKNKRKLFFTISAFTSAGQFAVVVALSSYMLILPSSHTLAVCLRCSRRLCLWWAYGIYWKKLWNPYYEICNCTTRSIVYPYYFYRPILYP